MKSDLASKVNEKEDEQIAVLIKIDDADKLLS